MDLGVLASAPPAELGALRQRRPLRSHLAAMLVDLAARGHLLVEDAGNDPEIGEALDWRLTLLDPPGQEEADRRGLRLHEERLLDVVATAPDDLLSQVRSSKEVTAVLEAVRVDTVERGWLHGHFPPRRTSTGRVVAAELAAVRSGLLREPCTPKDAVDPLPQAVALGMGALWAARLGRQRPAPPSWLVPGTSMTARGRLAVTTFVLAASASPPPGGGAGSAMRAGGGSCPGGW